MISAIDTNVLLDVLTDSVTRGDESQAQLDRGRRSGSLVISEAVYAELAPRFEGPAQLDYFIENAGIDIQRSSRETLHWAGRAWRAYSRRRPRVITCTQCGEPQTSQCEACGAVLQVRQHVLADFLIGAHAAVQADRLITRDRGYYATYFPDLELA